MMINKPNNIYSYEKLGYSSRKVETDLLMTEGHLAITPPLEVRTIRPGDGAGHNAESARDERPRNLCTLIG